MNDLGTLVLIQTIALSVIAVFLIILFIVLLVVACRLNKFLSKADAIADDIKHATGAVRSSAENLEKLLNPAVLVKTIVAFIHRLRAGKKR